MSSLWDFLPHIDAFFHKSCFGMLFGRANAEALSQSKLLLFDSLEDRIFASILFKSRL